MSDLDLLLNAYLPNETAATVTYNKWRASYSAEAKAFDAYLNAVKAGQTPAPPGMTSRKGKALVAAVRMAVGDTAPTPTPDPTPDPSSSYPASFYTGPAGQNIILPPAGRKLIGNAPGGAGTTLDQAIQQMTSRESYFGRRFDARHAFWNQATSFNVSEADSYYSHGWTPMVSWSPPGYTADQINSGAADGAIKSMASSMAAYGKPVLMRMYHEFNGGWPTSSYWFKYGCVGDKFISMWRRTVDIMRQNGVAKTSFVWCPQEGFYRPDMPPSYPGDNYVDWVASDGYNHNNPNAWCGSHAGWCQFWEIFHHGKDAANAVGVEKDFRGRKPFMVAEYGCLEDTATAGRKGQWFVTARDRIKTDFPGLYGLVYFDINYTDGNWKLDTSTPSMDGFKQLFQDPVFGG